MTPCILAPAGQTHVVDASDGGDFVDLRAAIDAACDRAWTPRSGPTETRRPTR